MLCRGQGYHLLHKPRSGNGTEVSGPLGNLRHATEHMYPWEDLGSRFRTLLWIHSKRPASAIGITRTIPLPSGGQTDLVLSSDVGSTVIWCWFLLFSHSLLRKHASCPEELKAFTQGLTLRVQSCICSYCATWHFFSWLIFWIFCTYSITVSLIENIAEL